MRGDAIPDSDTCGREEHELLTWITSRLLSRPAVSDHPHQSAAMPVTPREVAPDAAST
jgi:hypothetical protein